jgi:hypothetical protein
MINFIRTQILQQAGTAILAQGQICSAEHPHPAQVTTAGVAPAENA